MPGPFLEPPQHAFEILQVIMKTRRSRHKCAASTKEVRIPVDNEDIIFPDQAHR
jgi:hypothetical protein